MKADRPFSIRLAADLAKDPGQAESWCRRLRQELLALPDPDDRFVCELICREAIQNALEHGNRGVADRRIHVAVLVEEGLFQCRISDEGAGFSGFQPKEPGDERELREGGHGLAIIASYASSWHLDDGGRTIVCECKLGPRSQV